MYSRETKKIDTPQKLVIKNEINRNFLTLPITSTCPSQSLGCWCDTNENRKTTFGEIPYGLAVRIPGFHPGGPGSTPGMGKDAFFLFCFNNSGFSVVYSYVWE